MRISDSMMSGSFINNLNKTKENLQKLRTDMAAGSKINKPSDSPDGAVKLLRLNSQYEQSETFINNIDNTLSFMKETTFAMETVQTEVEKVMTALHQSVNAGLSNLNSFADQVDSSMKFILDAANSSYDGKFLFGGTDHSDKPYSLNTAGTAVTENTNPSGEHLVKISANSLQKINVTGKEVFGNVSGVNGSDIFNTLIKIKDNLAQGITPSAEEIKAISEFNLHLLNKIASTGNNINQLEDSSELQENHKLVIKELMSKEQDIDIAQSMIDLQNQDYLLQMILKISSTILPKSLMDYM